MATLSAALYLSGIPKDEFEEDLEDHYSMASNLLDSPNKLKEEWRCSTPLSHASTDSGYSRSLPDEPMTDVQVRIMENKAVVDFLKSVNTMADLKSAFTLLEVIDNIENRYYAREDEIKVAKEHKEDTNEPKILYQGRNLLNLLDNIRSSWRPSFAVQNDNQEAKDHETSQDSNTSSGISKYVIANCQKENCNYLEPIFY